MRTISTQTTRLTVADTDTFSTYMREIRPYRSLSRSEEAALFAAYADPAASDEEQARCRERIICHNQLFVVSVAKCYHRKNGPLSLADLVQAGNVGLVLAVKAYDPKTHNKFISYAVWWIRKYISQELARYETLVSRPAHHYFQENRHYRDTEKQRLTAEGESQPPAPSVHTARLVIQSLDACCGETELNAHEYVPSESEGAGRDRERVEHLRGYTQRALGRLSVISASVLTQLYGLDGSAPLSKETVARNLGYSVETVRKMQGRAQTQLKHALAGLTGCSVKHLAAEMLCN